MPAMAKRGERARRCEGWGGEVAALPPHTHTPSMASFIPHAEPAFLNSTVCKSPVPSLGPGPQPLAQGFSHSFTTHPNVLRKPVTPPILPNLQWAPGRLSRCCPQFSLLYTTSLCSCKGGFPNFVLKLLNSQVKSQPKEGPRFQDHGLRNAGKPILPE